MKTGLLKQVKEACQAHHPVLPPPISFLQKNLNQKLKSSFSQHVIAMNHLRLLNLPTRFLTHAVSEDPDITVRAKPPPSIFMKGINDFPGFCITLIELIGVDNFICKATTNRLKIQTANLESYRLLIHYLNEHIAKYHTYQLAEDKPTRIAIRNIHPIMPIELIKSELETRLFGVRQVTNVLH
jgi:hypothetical protein